MQWLLRAASEDHDGTDELTGLHDGVNSGADSNIFGWEERELLWSTRRWVSFLGETGITFEEGRETVKKLNDVGTTVRVIFLFLFLFQPRRKK